MLQQYKTQGGILVEFTEQALEYKQGIEPLIERLDSERGAIFASTVEYPGRYTCWDIGFLNPPLVLTCRQNKIILEALNARGQVLLSFIAPMLVIHNDLKVLLQNSTRCEVEFIKSERFFSEEERSHQPSVFSVIRSVLACALSNRTVNT